MRARTIALTFGMIATVSLLCLVGEMVGNRLLGKDSPKIHHILPVSSAPHLYRRVFHPEEMANATEELKAQKEKKWITLKLRGGNEVFGELVSEEPGWVTLLIDGSQVGFRSAEILERKQGRPEE